MTLTRDAYIRQPSPIEADLLGVFDRNSALVVFDIGSCEGEDSIRYARLFPRATIYAVEPLPANLERMRTNLELYASPGVQVVPLAFSDQRGHASFYVSSGRPPHVAEPVDWDYGNKSSSLLPPDQHLVVHPWVRFDEVVEVETDTLAAFCAERSIEGADLIHLDVQGAELRVLAGGEQVLEHSKLVWLEVGRLTLYRDQPRIGDVEQFMRAHGFRLARQAVGEVAGDQLWANERHIRGWWPLRRLRGRARGLLHRAPGSRSQTERADPSGR